MELYNRIMLDAARSEKFRVPLKKATVKTKKGVNPTCSDQIEISAEISAGKIENLSFSGHGCIISLAATNLLLEQIHHQNLETAENILKDYLKMLRGETPSETPSKTPGEPPKDKTLSDSKLKNLEIFESLKNSPGRVNCAAFPAKTLLELIGEE